MSTVQLLIWLLLIPVLCLYAPPDSSAKSMRLGGRQEGVPPAASVSLSGYVRDSASREVLIGASMYIAELATGITSNTYGFYSVTVPPDTYTLTVTHLGYRPFTQTISLLQDQ